MLCFLSVSRTLSLWRYPHLKGFLFHCYRWSSRGEVRGLVHGRAGTRIPVFCLLPSPEIQRRNPSLWDFQGLYPPNTPNFPIARRWTPIRFTGGALQTLILRDHHSTLTQDLLEGGYSPGDSSVPPGLGNAGVVFEVRTTGFPDLPTHSLPRAVLRLKEASCSEHAWENLLVRWVFDVILMALTPKF